MVLPIQSSDPQSFDIDLIQADSNPSLHTTVSTRNDLSVLSHTTASSPDLDTSEHCETTCHLCSQQIVELEYVDTDTPVPILVDQSTKDLLFHQPCTQCDGAKSRFSITLCDVCRHLRTHHLFFCWHNWLQLLSTHPVLSLEVHFQPSDPKTSQCSFCLFIHSMEENYYVPQPDERVSNDRNKTWRLTFDGILEKWLCGNLEIGGFIDLYTKPEGTLKLVIEPWIDWKWLQTWLNEPRNEQKSVRTALTLQSRQDLQEVRVIDIHNLCVVDLPSKCDYVALSYVWGANSATVFRCERDNVKFLAQHGVLKDIELPRTITDAIIACQNLDFSFLWVDRLCIIQDDDNISVQLNQMAAIYHSATLTFVAVAGDADSHGLPGVSYPRDPKQSVLRYKDSLEVAGPMSWLGAALSTSVWQRRAWTYQEHIASSQLLFFTDKGLYLQPSAGKGRTLMHHLAEGPQTTWDFYKAEKTGLKMVERFTEKIITFPKDKLRAISGILTALYGDRTCFGIPYAKFDVAIYWSPSAPISDSTPIPTGLFPTWSWPSHNGPVDIVKDGLPLIGVSCWRIPGSSHQTESFLSTWAPIKRTWDNFSAADWKVSLEVATAIAWLHGCISLQPPAWLSINCSASDYKQRINERWSKDISIPWNRFFRSRERAYLFDNIDRKLLNTPSRLVSYTQTSAFSLDLTLRSTEQPTERTANNYIMRAKDNSIAGLAMLDTTTYASHDQVAINATLLALSIQVGNDKFMTKQWDYYPNLSALYGCPCSSPNRHISDLDHILECPHGIRQHPPVGCHSVEYLESKYKSLAYHISAQAYCDIHGRPLIDFWTPPQMNVMIIAPSRRHNGPGKVYERIGIGWIYLKRWVESSPVFETIVLE
jgi:hypothetical protein